MKPATRARFLRVFMSSVFASQLTKAEILELAKEFHGDPELTYSMRNVLLHAAKGLDAFGVTEEHSAIRSSQLHTEEDAYSIIKKRKIPKEKVVQAIFAVSQRFHSKYPWEALTVRELLTEFYGNSSESEQDRFFDIVTRGASSGDAFLQGILRDR